ncbi:phosphatidylinositol N-acetylglucosaminyltransferase, putative [Talaromyces stipitatus ATCC 10500]|uniref:Phosphatidylinositol N-acetylglucosaminyltransferase, putative n=1 Tax=Talaromyces stipitatus (strain ATCC 10500 / CBS 375.48 / QM 6759 / NRRL 1006) TaxID=441959 RepID=B8M6L4_TALSN|nr:phosphatidylinositol N-acetylglucosaminyltransferase, putative [Talaromyces stipitatus ATCC 10500]EED19476.1 phosphatidylinositol N-acetylglucosaminyltransferase, putative [Talaromyces stipitatus ATCC 10500]
MSPRLTVQRPSPSTVLFTASNAPARCTWSSKLAFGIEVLLRIVGFLLVLLVNFAKVRHFISITDGDWGVSPELWATKVGSLACRIADYYTWPIVAIASAILTFAVWRKRYTEESLLVIRGLGVQTSTSSSMYWSSAATRFIPTTQIQDIVIHEAFKGFEVRFYLAIIVEGEGGVVVVFPNLLPKRMLLEEVWRGARQCLYESKTVPLPG